MPTRVVIRIKLKNFPKSVKKKVKFYHSVNFIQRKSNNEKKKNSDVQKWDWSGGLFEKIIV